MGYQISRQENNIGLAFIYVPPFIAFQRGNNFILGRKNEAADDDDDDDIFGLDKRNLD